LADSAAEKDRLNIVHNKNKKLILWVIKDVAKALLTLERVAVLRDEDLIIPESMTQDFGCTVVLETQAHSKLRNCFSGAAVESKDKSDSGIIESSFLTTYGE